MEKSSELGDDDNDGDLLSFPPLLTRLTRRSVDVGDGSLATPQSLSGSQPRLGIPVDERGGEHTDQEGGAETGLPSDQRTIYQPVQYLVAVTGKTAPGTGIGLPPPLVASTIEAGRLQPAAAVAAAARASEEGTEEVTPPSEAQQWVDRDEPTARDATVVGDEVGVRDEIPATIPEAEYRSVLRTEGKEQNNGAAAFVEDEPRTSNATSPCYAEDLNLWSTEPTWPDGPHLRGVHDRRSHDARRTSVGVALAVQERRGEVESAHSQYLDQIHPDTVEHYDLGKLRGESSNSHPMPSEETATHARAGKREGVANIVEEEKLVHGCETHHGHNESDKWNGSPPGQHLAQAQTARYVGIHDGAGFRTAAFDNHTRCTIDNTVDPERGSKAEESPLPGGGGTTGGGEAAWPPSPPSFSDSLGTESYHSPRRRQYDASQQRRERALALSLDYRSLSFVERQELEQVAAEHRREEVLRAEEEARRELASGGSWMNRTSRAILARSSSLPPPRGGGRSAPPGTGGRRHEPSVFERLSRRASEHDGINSMGWAREMPFGGSGDGCRGRQPFTPMINPRSSRLAPGASHRDEAGGPQERLYREGEEQLRRRERRVELADRALRERSVSCHINPGSERVLARRNRLRVIRFQAKMMEVLKAVDTEGTGWLSFAGLERVLGECEMLPGQAPPEVYDDVLLAVWTALSRANPCGGGSGDSSGAGDHGDGGASDGDAGFGRDKREEACGVAVERLSVLLTGVASSSYYGCERTNTSGSNDSACRHANLRKAGRKPSSLNPANSRLWRDDEEERESSPSETHSVETALRSDEQLEDLCNDLSDIFKINEQHRISRQQEVQGPKAMGVAGGRTGAPPTAAVTPAQVAATTARFEEQIRAKDRKIELMRKAKEDRNNLTHPFEPSMATSSTSQAAAASRRQSVGRGDRSNGVVDDEGKEPKKTDVRTTEERDLDDNCTFRPRLFRPLPISPPRYPTAKTAHSRGEGDPGKRFASSGDEASPRTSVVDRATASWMAQVERLTAGRKDRLRRLGQKRALENRTEPLPPSVQQLFCDAGMEINPQLRGIAPAGRATKQGNARFAEKRVASTRGPRSLSRNVSSSPPRLHLEARLHARNQQKQKRSEEQARKSAEEDARRQKQKRLLARARKRSAAVAGLEAALAARGVERGRASWSDPPVLIAEVEFVRQRCWVLLPLWGDTCPREAVGELARRQPRAVVGTVAADLEASIRVEMQHAREQTTGVGLERGREAFGGGKSDRGGNNRRAVPKVVLRVDLSPVDEPGRDVVGSID